ncbi:caspase family protein [Dactylosporangium sp. CA-139066]|uniref:caspase family protein n=1 Tax=Dactylosporangium sp. CA-139066 TaxID=3239930 RepID=UPI003D8AE8D5
MRRALLIGAQTGELEGVDNDVAAMADALGPRGFGIRTLTGASATRKGIIEAYRELVDDTAPGDACVVYYSGHGGLLRPPDDAPPPADDPLGAGRPDLQFIVPADYHDSTAEDFRGITGLELSSLLATLTDVTANATVVLDCCHAAHVSRRPDRRVKALLRPAETGTQVTYDSVRRHDERWTPRLRGLHSNPRAVRVVACAPHESAWEAANRHRVTMGVFTDALARILDATRDLRINWLTLLDAVRREVQDLSPTQRPEAEGPSGRLPFETEELYPTATLPVVVTDPGRIRLLGAPLIGVRPGDEFAIMPAAAADPDDGEPVGTARVTGLLPMAAAADLALAPGRAEVPADARAHQTLAAEPRMPVRLPDHPAAADLAARMAVRPLLRPAEPGERASIAVAAGVAGLVVHDGVGPLHAPHPATPAGLDEIVANLLRIAQATAVRRLAADPAAGLDHVRVEWGRAGNGRPEPLPATGGLLYGQGGDHLYVAVHNDGDGDVYCSLIDIGVSYRIQLLTAADPGGRRIRRRSAFVYGRSEDTGRLDGAAVRWPAGIDASQPRPETILAVISDAPVDVSVLQQAGVRGATPLSPLARLLTQAVFGGTREVGPMPGRMPRYTVVPVDFSLSPSAAPAREAAAFAVDDRPSEAVRELAPRGEPPVPVAVRLDDVAVPAPYRLDALVVTDGPGGRPVYRAATVRPGGDPLLYEGPAADRLDVAVWATPDAPGRPGLADELPEGLADVAAAVDAAERVLGDGEGLYRTTLLAREDFGAGAHRRRCGDFAFTLEIAAGA